jgi:hypothetical protein
MEMAWTCHFEYVLLNDGKAIAGGDAEAMAAVVNAFGITDNNFRLLKWYEWMEWQVEELRHQQKKENEELMREIGHDDEE